MIKEIDILRKTHYGLNIYSKILQQCFPDDDFVIHLSGKQCKPAKNPFNNNKLTLNIHQEDSVFLFNDSELADFSGNPFDFATKYYKLEGDKLLMKINKELNLRIGEKINYHINDTFNHLRDQEPVEIPVCSFFEHPITNTSPKKIIDLVYAHNLIKYNHYQKQTQELRTITDPREARSYKAKNFDYVTFSGTLAKRNDASLIKHSGLLTIDFDHIENIEKLKSDLLSDDYFETELMFTSPSGDGLKWIISIDINDGTHSEIFGAISNYIKYAYNIEVDKSGKDISRACFLPHDKNVFINPKYLQ